MADVVTMPKLGFDMAEGKLVRWLKSEGEPVEKGEVLAEIETDKATVEVEALVGGVVRKHLISEDASVPVGEPIAVIGTADEAIDLDSLVGGATAQVAADTGVAEAPTPSPTPATTATEEEEGGDGRLPDGVRASPLARKLAEENDLDLRRIAGSGPQGRIVVNDVRQAMQAGGVAPQAAYAMRQPLPAERVPLAKLRAAIGRRMTASKQQVPHFYVTSEVDAAPLMTMRSQINAALPDDQKTSVNDFVVKAAALALRQFPSLNASLDGDAIVRHGDINIGVAVALENGLMTVVVRQADMKPLLTISQETRALAARARSGKVRPDDVEGSTFTVSNLGMFDVDHFIAIINPPEAAILAVGSVREAPVVKDGAIVPGRLMRVTLSADHRVTDGAEGARWLQIFRDLIEQPVRLVMDGLGGGFG